MDQFWTSEVRARPIEEEVSTVSSNAVVVDLEVDFHNEDETGYVLDVAVRSSRPLHDRPWANSGGR